MLTEERQRLHALPYVRSCGFLFAFVWRGVADTRFCGANWCFACRVSVEGFYSRSFGGGWLTRVFAVRTGVSRVVSALRGSIRVRLEGGVSALRALAIAKRPVRTPAVAINADEPGVPQTV